MSRKLPNGAKPIPLDEVARRLLETPPKPRKKKEKPKKKTK